MKLYQAVPDCEESEAEHLSPVHWCCVAYEPVVGRWVPWCVTHRSTQDWEHTWEDVCTEGWDTDDCRWHPKGAFIPEVDELPAGASFAGRETSGGGQLYDEGGTT